MKHQVLDILDFVGMENKNFMVSLVNSSEELQALGHVQGLYNAALQFKDVKKNDIIIFQLLVFVHYHFLNSTATLMRCHLSEAFHSTRIAIDAALIATHIIKDRASQEAYLERTKPFDKLNRHYKNLISENKQLPHPYVPYLIKLHDKLSQFASHADIGSFFHRAKVKKDAENLTIFVEYFQFSRDKNEKKYYFFSILHHFVMILDVFADFLVKEQKIVAADWHEELQTLGGAIERNAKELKGKFDHLYAEETAEK